MVQDTNKPNVLVMGATSRQGNAACKALLSNFNVYGTSRSVPNERLAKQGINALKTAYGDGESVRAALAEAKPKAVYFFTDFSASGKKEVEHGKQIVDILAEYNKNVADEADKIQHVVFGSCAACDIAPENVVHFKTKFQVENYLKAHTEFSEKWTMIRPVAFFDNFDDANNWNALKKGALKSLWPGDLKVKMCATDDIGKAAAVAILNPDKYKKKVIDVVGQDITGNEAAQILSDVSGVKCSYRTAVPKFILNWFMGDMGAMVDFFHAGGFKDSSVAEFKKVVPDAIDCRGFFTRKGQWANGEKFAPEK